MCGALVLAFEPCSGVIPHEWRYQALPLPCCCRVRGLGGCLAGVSWKRELRAAGASGSERACTSVRGFGAFRPGSLIRRVLPLWAVLNLES